MLKLLGEGELGNQAQAPVESPNTTSDRYTVVHAYYLLMAAIPTSDEKERGLLPGERNVKERGHRHGQAG